jgi:hypothetical protein
VLSRILGIGLVLSLAANAGTAALYYRAKAETQSTVAAVAAGANERLTQSLSHQATAFEERVAELTRRLELSNEVTKDAQERAYNATAELRTFRELLRSESTADPAYAEWAAAELPAGVAERLRGLQ